MDELQGRRQRRLRLRRAAAAPVERETAESVLPELPRVGALDALLREVDSLRLTLETDLSLAASAVEHGAPDVAADVIDSDIDELDRFERRALKHVSDLSVTLPVTAAPSRRRIRIPAAPFVAAAAVVGFLVGVAPHITQHSSNGPTQVSLTASASLTRLTEAADRGETTQVIAAASQLHNSLAGVLLDAGSDPTAARAALAMLQAERTAIQQSDDPDQPALLSVIAASRRLTTLIYAALPSLPLPSVPPVPVVSSSPVVVIATQPPAPYASSQPTTAPTAPTAPTPKATGRSASPTATPKPKASPSVTPSPTATPSSKHSLPAGPDNTTGWP